MGAALYADGSVARRGDVLVLSRPAGPARELSVDFLSVDADGLLVVRGVEVLHLEPRLAGLTVDLCQWFARCSRPADGVVDHPVLGGVPTCSRCAENHDLELLSADL